MTDRPDRPQSIPVIVTDPPDVQHERAGTARSAPRGLLTYTSVLMVNDVVESFTSAIGGSDAPPTFTLGPAGDGRMRLVVEVTFDADALNRIAQAMADQKGGPGGG